MRLLAKACRKAIVLGAYKAWELLSANSSRVRDQVHSTKSRLGTAVRRAEGDVKDASHDADESVIDASRIAVAEVAEAVADAALGGSSANPVSEKA
jgi:hypothetical protein